MQYDQANFLSPIEDSLLRIQSLCDKYQHDNFQKRPPEFFCLELCGEVGELANLEKKVWKGKHIASHLLADEAADTLIALMNYANARGINLGKAVSNKLEIIEKKRKELAAKGESY